ncbi:MAG: PilW family protein [Pseudomonadota bacterium]|nr:PilW family protein [Pseudomonadota bacterium]
MKPRPLSRARGFTLVELMVGLTVGLFVAAGAISIFVSTRKLQTVSTAKSRMAENSRLAMELLHKDFRSAGFQGCKPRLQGAPASLLAPGNGIFLDSGSSGLGGSHGDGTSFTPSLNATLAGLAQAPDVNSDVVSLRVPVEPMSLGLAAPMTSSVGAPTVGANTVGNSIVAGDIVLIANCKAAAMFQVTEANPKATGLLSHAIGGSFVPGNATDDLLQVFRGDSALYRLQTHHYYVAPSAQRPGTSSMWRYTAPNTDGSTNPQEVVQGVERMLVSYGIDKGDQTVNRYVTAGGVTSWNSVVAARIQLLTATVNDGVTIGTQAVSFAGSAVVPTDRRLRSQVTEVVALRNRAP